LQDYYRTQFEILRSRRIVEPVVDALNVREREEFASAADPVFALTEALKVEPVRDSRLVRVSVDSKDKAFAASAANAVVDQFVDENNQRVLGVSDSGLRKLKEMEHQLRPKHEAAAQALQAFKEENDLLSLDETHSVALDQVKSVAEELGRARADRAKAV